MSTPHGRATFSPSPDLTKLLGYWAGLEKLYAAFGEAARRVEAATGQPTCVPGCGLCCQHNTVHAYGVEAEYAASILLGKPENLKPAIDACRDWLTRKGNWTYGRQITSSLWNDLVNRGELIRALTEDCPFLQTDKRCLIHDGRPTVCRAYGITRLPGRECKRPAGLMEEDGKARVWWDPHHASLPLYDMLNGYIATITEPRYRRMGFLPMMIFERFNAKELAGLLDDGKVPLVKMTVGMGQGYNLLWQEEMEATWKALSADKSIATQVPLVERNGVPVMQIGRPSVEVSE